GKTTRSRLAEAVETALRLTAGNLVVAEESMVRGPLSVAEESANSASSQRTTDNGQRSTNDPQSVTSDRLFSSHYACTHCNLSFGPPSPQLFSFNSPRGMCGDCNGLGMRHDFVEDRLIPDDKLSVAKGAVELLGPLKS